MPATIRDAHIKWCRPHRLAKFRWVFVPMKLNMCWSLVVFDLTKACVQLFQPYEVNDTDVQYTHSFLFAWREFFSRQLNRPDILDWKLTVAHSPHNPLRDESEILIVKYVELLKLAHYPVEFDSGKEACLEREKRELDAQKTGKTVCIHVFWKRVERSYACVRSRPFFFRKA